MIYDKHFLTNKFWDEHFREKNKDELKGMKLRIFNWLNGDNFGGFVLFDNNTFYFEKTVSSAKMPNYIYNYLIKWGKKQGFKYIMEVTK